MNEFEVISKLKDIYRKCTHYSDNGTIVDWHFGEERKLTFKTRFYAPGRLKYTEFEENKETLKLKVNDTLCNLNEIKCDRLSPVFSEEDLSKTPKFLEAYLRQFNQYITNPTEPKFTDHAMAGLYGSGNTIWIIANLLLPEYSYCDWTRVYKLQMQEINENYYCLLVTGQSKIFGSKIWDITLWIDKESYLVKKLLFNRQSEQILQWIKWTSLFVKDRDKKQKLNEYFDKTLKKPGFRLCTFEYAKIRSNV